ncbi:hypothetical protein FB45DRAFT_1038147 [Roridomyces roridus]|uniref:Uncharacterized protein n=1 Tax=Roridomyces roridus TaxID=1738132 RepID=A0AAD7F989_9AGAR|nr:hypothetical protein FB45DRAFT_1038147 [Roridomyces roridus]
MLVSMLNPRQSPQDEVAALALRNPSDYHRRHYLSRRFSPVCHAYPAQGFGELKDNAEIVYSRQCSLVSAFLNQFLTEFLGATAAAPC